MVQRGDFVYVADGDGLSVYTNPAKGPIERIFHVPTPGYASDLAFVGSTLLVADGRAGLAEFSLNTPDRPALIRQFAAGSAVKRIFQSERAAAAITDDSSLLILRPGLPPERLSLPGEPRDAAFIGEHLYVADSGDGLLRVALHSNVASIASRDRGFRWAISLAAVGGRLLIGTQDKRVALYDVGGRSPTLISSVSVAHLPSRLFVLGDRYVLVAGREDRGKGATLLDMHEPNSIVVRGNDASFVSGALLVDPAHALVAQGADGMALLSLDPFGASQARAPGLLLDRVTAVDGAVIAWGENRGGARAFALATGAPMGGVPEHRIRDGIQCGDALCTLDNAGQICRDPLPGKTDPPRACARVEEGGRAIGWQPEAGLLWLLDDAGGGLFGFRRSNQTQGFLRAAGVARPPGTDETAKRLVIERARAAAIDPILGLLQVFDIGESPRRRGRFVLQGKPSGLAFAGGAALVATNEGLQIVDLTDADKPVEIGWYAMKPGPLGVAAYIDDARRGEARVALAEGENGFSLWAWDGRGGLSAIARSDTPGVASDLVFAGDSLWVADGTGMIRCRLMEPRP